MRRPRSRVDGSPGSPERVVGGRSDETSGLLRTKCKAWEAGTGPEPGTGKRKRKGKGKGKMSSGIYTDRSAVPWWAAFGAPLVGVPILVGLLALGGARSADAKVGPQNVTTVESVQSAVELPPVSIADGFDLSC